MTRVLRAQPGTEADVVAGGRVFHAEVAAIMTGGPGKASEVRFNLIAELEAEPALPVTLVMSVYKFDHMEWAIEKSTELGVASITPILARRTEKHLAQSALKRSERWRRIALEASKQSRRTDIPEIADPIALKSALDLEKSPTRILLSETEQQSTLSAVLQASLGPTAFEAASQSVAIAIGPEGGWTPEEMSLFTQHQWQSVTLGPRILRAETAAIAAIAIAATHLC
jgi:16S rRNA (uracil1498-N3)-methyltransferase